MGQWHFFLWAAPAVVLHPICPVDSLAMWGCPSIWNGGDDGHKKKLSLIGSFCGAPFLGLHWPSFGASLVTLGWCWAPKQNCFHGAPPPGPLEGPWLGSSFGVAFILGHIWDIFWNLVTMGYHFLMQKRQILLSLHLHTRTSLPYSLLWALGSHGSQVSQQRADVRNHCLGDTYLHMGGVNIQAK